MKDIVVIGFGGHGKSLVDSIRDAGLYRVVGYTDLHETDRTILYLGTDEVLEEAYSRGIRYAALGIGYMGASDMRDALADKARGIGFSFPPIVDPSAVVSKSAAIGEGSFIAKSCVINAGAYVGDMCIINTGAILEHDVRIGDYSHIAGGAVLCGNVRAGDHAFIGANATVIQGISVKAHAIVGAGSVILKDVPDHKTVYGVWKGEA